LLPTDEDRKGDSGEDDPDDKTHCKVPPASSIPEKEQAKEDSIEYAGHCGRPKPRSRRPILSFILSIFGQSRLSPGTPNQSRSRIAKPETVPPGNSKPLRSNRRVAFTV
jgi:hypothetical protein